MNVIKRLWNFLNAPTILWGYVVGSLPMFFVAFDLEGTIGKTIYILFVIIIYSKVIEKYILKKT
ncbi:hypothetical protein SAMN05878443_0227 [Carnobacterium alterfunditum]|uniref:Uncharacterized protein n=1 Tax=Carnobacterium alterfunditum TaxID=28230 RepID=A0A1N6EVM5_9LACT|nr:hypothetical protein [Carnobacterium alterfunditum]SIN87034.1 hypothetical protein SAMN05878443_0227 [Carnobacterium alterfunditum]